MFKEGVFGNAYRGRWLRLLISLIFATALLLSGSTVGAGISIPMPMHVQPTEWTIAMAGTLIDAQGVKGPSRNNPKLESSLNQLLEEHRREGLAKAQDFATTHMMVLDDDRVQVVIITTQDAISDLKEAVEALGGEYQSHYEALLQALVPIDALELLAERADVRVVREPRRPILLAPMQVGSKTTEGVAASNASAWHTAGYDGTGVRVAVIDGGFTGYSGLLGTDLPASVTTYDWTGTGMAGSPHGTACAEIVYDMAPGATMYLHKVSTDIELGNAVNQAIADDVDIISMSLNWALDGPGDGTGSIANIVKNARSSGIFYTAAAGNDAEVSWSGFYVDSPSVPGSHQWPNFSNLNCFGPGTPDFACYYVPAGYPINVGLHWDDWTVVNQDYDMVLYRWTGSTWSFVAGSYNRQAASYPTPEEFIGVDAPYRALYGVVILKYSTTRNACLSLDAPKMTHLDEWVAQRSLGHPADSADAITVGAVDVDSYILESYSSQGPTFGSGGTCSGGFTKPDVAAYANVSTVSYGDGGFNGTSAATPHVAGAAALVKDAYPGYTVTQLQSFLEGRAIDLGAAGKDNLYGSGRLSLGTTSSIPPKAPSSLTATPISKTQIDLSWTDNSGNEDGFKIERSPNGTSGWTQIASVGAGVTTYANTVLTCETTYYYRVRAYDAGGDSDYSNVANAQTMVCIYIFLPFVVR